MYEWSAFTFGSLSVLLFVLSLFSVFQGAAPLELRFGGVETRYANGLLIFTNSLVNQDSDDAWLGSTSATMVTSDLHLNTWGVQFRSLAYSDGWTDWFVRMSTVVPLVLCSALTAFCWVRFRWHRTMNARQARSTH